MEKIITNQSEVKRKRRRAAPVKPGITAEDVADLVEHCLNETKPTLPTKRGVGNSLEIKVGRHKFVATVTDKPKTICKSKTIRKAKNGK